ncbi:MAG: hypothetical protein JSS32_05655 [Verrucomicrobia bacterium]|nr:hypothetical protein [Verrucomicrobiota bacterium]
MIGEVGEELRLMAGLKRFSIYKNQLMAFSEVLCRIDRLEMINASVNQIRELPEEI